MNNLMKVLLVFVLLGGGALGFGLEYMISSPQIRDLKQELNNTRFELDMLQTEYEELTNDYNSLNKDYEELIEETVPMEEYTELMEDFSELNEDYQSLEEELETVNNKLDDLNQTYCGLKNMYDNLVEEYNLRVLPLYDQTTIKGYKITLTIDETWFEHNKPLTGSVVITDEEGSPFYGNITFSVKNVHLKQFKFGYKHSIKGETKYSISGAFQWGAGRYSVGLEKLIDSTGTVVLDYTDLKDFRLQFEVL
ncbi:MAG: coiled-coil domain-containing protein [Candidatus Bathyarchaeia archaeon]